MDAGNGQLPTTLEQVSIHATLPTPIAGERNVLVTSALPYVNNVPHLGNLIGSVLSADVYARYLRQTGVNVLFICGTDEYGTATETKAAEEGVTPRQLCDKYHRLHRDIYRWFDLGFDHFGRTSTPRQTEICQEIFWQVYHNGYCTEQTVAQLYDVEAGKFLADRYVHGTCPRCGYEDAQGDQCDQCGNLLNPTELVRPRSALTGSVPEVRTSRHLFLELPRLADALQRWVDAAAERGGWSDNALTMTRSWLRDGLKPRCITRDLQWGVPVPLDGFTDKVFYVWFDAPIGYLSITAAAWSDRDRWRAWWQHPEQVELVQFMGKDNTPFHTVIFPCTLLATQRPWTMLQRISTTEYLNYEGGKFSKRRGTGVFGDSAADTGIPAYVWRYYLVANRPEQSDSVFTWDDLAAKNNNELLANVGNLVNRTVSLVKSGFQGVLPALTDAPGYQARERRLFAAVTDELREYHRCFGDIALKAALRCAMAIGKLGNQYLQESKPWDLLKEPASGRERARTVLAVAAGVVRLLAICMEPFMGGAFADRILQQVGVVIERVDDRSEVHRIPHQLDAALVERWFGGARAHRFGEPSLLFRKMLPEQVAQWRARFAGDAAARAESKPPADVFPLDLRIGRITRCEPHPASDRLYVLRVQLDEAQGERTVVAGLRIAYPAADSLLQRRVLLCCNMEEATLAGVPSEAMLLVAEKHDHQRVLCCDGSDGGDEAACGTRVYPYDEGAESESAVAMNRSTEEKLDRKRFQAVSKALRIDATGRLRYQNRYVLRTDPGGQAIHVDTGAREGDEEAMRWQGAKIK
ncbi:hypothetical protein CDCA_CDCA05G1455 [Cyanidium caldarium]|uniref:methionine--tRNA ligase n=1 Tax=Cyanidium caldarium TaxID=2771 RepID=A0AAV9IT09_CYACA|nr:hypothetical protein CDCA_CDCA05G1455 [Cyanidium caldarium]